MEGIESDDEERKVAGGSRKEDEAEDQRMELVDHPVAKSLFDFGIDPSARVMPADGLSRCRQVSGRMIFHLSCGSSSQELECEAHRSFF